MVFVGIFFSGTKADLKALNLYNSYLTDGAQNFTQKNNDEIIHTIILKKPKPTIAPTDQSKQNDQVIIQFGTPDLVNNHFEKKKWLENKKKHSDLNCADANPKKNTNMTEKQSTLPYVLDMLINTLLRQSKLMHFRMRVKRIFCHFKWKRLHIELTIISYFRSKTAMFILKRFKSHAVSKQTK